MCGKGEKGIQSFGKKETAKETRLKWDDNIEVDLKEIDGRL
jgi:hypothetical protein